MKERKKLWKSLQEIAELETKVAQGLVFLNEPLSLKLNKKAAYEETKQYLNDFMETIGLIGPPL